MLHVSLLNEAFRENPFIKINNDDLLRSNYVQNSIKYVHKKIESHGFTYGMINNVLH